MKIGSIQEVNQPRLDARMLRPWRCTESKLAGQLVGGWTVLGASVRCVGAAGSDCPGWDTPGSW
jgi:hypothetical protein